MIIQGSISNKIYFSILKVLKMCLKYSNILLNTHSGSIDKQSMQNADKKFN